MKLLPRVAPFVLGGLVACGPAPAHQPADKAAASSAAASGAAAAPKAPTAADAKAFVDTLDKDLRRLWVKASRADWVKNTYITEDTETMAAETGEDVLAYTSQAIAKAADFNGLTLDDDTARKLLLLKVSNPLPAPKDAEKRKELAAIASKLTSIYGKGKHCKKDAKGQEKCRDLGELSKVLAESTNYDEVVEAWESWRTISVEMRPMYERFVSLSNEGAREIGFKDTGELWRSAYDMPPDQFRATTDKLWTELSPLYQKLHCYVRGRLAAKYGKDKVPAEGLIPAPLLGNMWSQEWANIYPLVEPYKGQSSIDVTKALRAKKYDEKGMVKLGEAFFTSLGMDPLPESFWTRSQFVKPKDRDVVCHASAWDVTYDNDLRIKMCIKIDEEDLITIHHELGHNYYYMNYYKLPVLYQQGANDGFHEAIGDALALSVTPDYLVKLGILASAPKNDKALINLQMKDALEKIAFLPFGLLVDQWRWDVFAGNIAPAQYNKGWWDLRAKYQGIAPPSARGEELFDPGSKYHIPANVPYMRYFLARILQFQFHKALCAASGHTGPLHECSIYGNKEAGAKLKAMLAMGASRPWPDAMEAVTGTREMSAGPLVEYFQPLSAWLDTQLAGQKCGW